MPAACYCKHKLRIKYIVTIYYYFGGIKFSVNEIRTNLKNYTVSSFVEFFGKYALCDTLPRQMDGNFSVLFPGI